MGVSDVDSAFRVFTRQITSLGKAKALRDLLEYKDLNQSEQTNTLPGTSHFSPQARWYCMTQNVSHNHFEPQFPHLESRGNVGLRGWLSEFNLINFSCICTACMHSIFEHLLCAKPCIKCFVLICSFKPHNNPMRLVYYSPHFIDEKTEAH